MILPSVYLHISYFLKFYLDFWLYLLLYKAVCIRIRAGIVSIRVEVIFCTSDKFDLHLPWRSCYVSLILKSYFDNCYDLLFRNKEGDYG